MSILFAHDGKPETVIALEYAAKLSVALNESLYILTVVSKDKMDPDDIDASIQEYMEAAQKTAMDLGADVHTITEVGKPEDVTLEVAADFQCDTIVVGRPVRSRLDRMVMGSVSQNIIQNAKCTVIIVPIPEDDDE